MASGIIPTEVNCQTVKRPSKDGLFVHFNEYIVLAYEHWDFHLEENWANFIWGDNLQTLGTVHRTAWSTAIDDWESAADVRILYSSRSANRLESSWLARSILAGFIVFVCRRCSKVKEWRNL